MGRPLAADNGQKDGSGHGRIVYEYKHLYKSAYLDTVVQEGSELRQTQCLDQFIALQVLSLESDIFVKLIGLAEFVRDLSAPSVEWAAAVCNG